ncbi:HEAT repeat domain-containing protein [Cellvibrio fibrivorans]|uniref:Membrane-bound dehydrogenase-like protein n=1 Tax=Cellvibrio fibrivorans TaxID=126350 RepID=A0ABU1UWP8_9GAMM|nr:HEAT repeat domain-containing protein [Cellvibrio fibrivorans]MDR7089614.1 putative membrane-bound dehydrogenase-like protein [Cellvibrio fibrivorans]
MKQSTLKQCPLGIPLSRYLIVPIIGSLIIIGGCSKESPTSEAQQTQASAAASSAALDITRITPDEAKQTAQTIEQQVPMTLADGITRELWASEKLLGDTVAIHVDDKGRIWAGITQRSNNSEFDIRAYPDWEHPSVAFTTVEDRRAFLHSELAPEKSAQNERIPDRNNDGSHDWRDLAVVKEKVIRLEDTQGTGKADFAHTAVEDFNTEVTDVIGGMFYNDQSDELFVNVAPDFWRLKDTDGDGVMDSKTSLANGYGVHIGFSGHGLSGALLGPDGKMYYSMGDVGTSVTDSTGKKWHYPNQGVIVRSEIDGSNFEVFAAGLRNIYEFSFDKYGNFISVDNDGDHVGEYERVVHLIEGSDTGWRINWQLGKYKDPKNNNYKVWMDEEYYKPQFKGQAAHVLPPVAPYHAGPAGMTYNPGTAFNDQWKDHFFVVEFVGSATRAGVNAFTLKPQGASFELASDKNVFRGVLATGLDFGPDGALYMSDWIEGWGLKQKGRVWKLDTPDTAGNAIRTETKTLLAADLRKEPTEKLVELLNHVDMRVRQKAQFALVETQQLKPLQTIAISSSNQLARIHAIWGLGQILRKNPTEHAVLINLLQDADPEVRAQAAKVLGDANTTAATEKLLPLLADKNPRAQLYAAQALGRIRAESAIAPLVDMLQANNEQDVYLRHAGAIALGRIGNQEALSKLSTHPSEAVRVAAVVALKQMESPALALFLNDKSEFVVTNAARAINDDNLVVDALPALAKLIEQPVFTNEPLLRRAINANVYAGGNSAENANRLIQFAQQKNISGKLRAEAIQAVSVWAESSNYDRVTGMYRGPLDRPKAEAIAALGGGYSTLLADKDSNVREATVKALGELNIQKANDQLVELLKHNSSDAVRIAALHTLKKFNPANIGDLVFIALKDKSQSVRMKALALVPELNLPIAQVVEMHSILLKNGTTGEQQAALLSLANVKAPEAAAVFAEQMALLIDGKIAPEVQLELITAVEKIGTPEFKQLLATYESKKDKNNPLDIYRESIYGGNPDEGVKLFRYSNSTQCVRCHMVGTRGNKVGPDLTTIATRITPEQMLEALVAPAARIAPGFGRVTVALKTGERIEGSFDAETKTDVTITTNNQAKTIARTEIEKLEFGGISPMPPMGLGLTKAELRDLVAYLSTLKEEVHEGH